MATPRQRYIPELLEVHAADLAFLWDQRRSAMASRRHTLREFGELNERIEAHLQGLLIAPPDALLGLLRPQLAADDRGEAFAAAFALLRANQPMLTALVLDAFERARGPTLDGLCDALSAAPFGSFIGELQSVFDRAEPRSAVAAAAVLANHRLLTSQSARLPELLLHDDPQVCERAWRAATVTDARDPAPAHTRPYQHALNHPSPRVRHAAWAAAAWTGQAQALPLLRHLAERGDAVALHWLAVLGGPDDVPRVQQAALALEDAPARCRLLARFGHPSGLNALVRWMASDDAARAAAAGEAFERITGIEVHGERRPLPVAEDADAFEREMAPLVWLPDADKARALIDRHGEAWAAGGRWCRGRRFDLEPSPALLADADLELRWDIGARAALADQPVCWPPPVH
ncbi:HEAT repeat domain-containing protein [Aquabacterium sp.]|uniref:HEAT repeat domain-containing protein n=1 Tax=Aquabacterium sp. TaxID=1872578 RepID=UPI003784CFBD